VRGDVLLLALIPLGTLAFLAFRHFHLGEPFLTETYRVRWAVDAAWPWSNVADSLTAVFNTARFPALNPEDTHLRRIFYNSFDLACVGLFVSLTIASFRRLRLSYSLYMVSVLFVGLMQNFRPPYPIAAFPRYVLMLFPGFMVLGTLVRSGPLGKGPSTTLRQAPGLLEPQAQGPRALAQGPRAQDGSSGHGWGQVLHWGGVTLSTMLLALFTAMFATWRVVA
jgi:hypothetical protein